MTVRELLAQLQSLGDEKRRKHNAKTGPDGIPGAGDNQFGVPTGDIRKLAKRIKTPDNHALALELWKTGNMDAQLLAILMMKPKELSAKELDKLVRTGRFAWVADWLNAYIIKEQSDAEKETLRIKWMEDKDGWAARAGWNLTASKINKGGKGTEGLDVVRLLHRIEKELPKAPPEAKWSMNNTLAAIGIQHATHRKRAVAIGEKIGLYKDWPVWKGCTIPYVPVWVNEMVRRNG